MARADAQRPAGWHAAFPLRPFAVHEDAVPEFQDDEAHDLFQIDELPGLHFPNEPADACGVEVAAFPELGLAEGVGGELEEFIQQGMGRGGEGIGGEMADGGAVSAASLVSSCGEPKPLHTWCERCETVMQQFICQNAQKKPPLFPLESVLI